MILRVFKFLGQILLTIILTFGILELGTFVLGYPPGATDYVEIAIFRSGMSYHKPKDEIRIFTFGESTMHGAHYAPVSTPARWLEEYLRDYLPGKKIRIVNFARMGHGIHFTYDAFRGAVSYQPDIAIFYMGHNDFFTEERCDQVESVVHPARYEIRRWIQKSRFVSMIYRWIIVMRLNKRAARIDDRMGHEIIEIPPRDLKGAATTPRNEAFYARNIAFFKEYLLKILELGEKKHVRMLFLRPVSNLKDFAPFTSVHLKPLAPEELDVWQQAYAQGNSFATSGNFDQALIAYEKAYAIDPTYAELCYKLGRLYFKKGDLSKAKTFFEEARDNDAIVLRANDSILGIYDDLSQTKNLQLMDTEKVLIPETPGGILGEPVIEDNVHFSVKGQSLVGRQMAREISKRNWILPESQWHFENERGYEEIAKEMGVTNQLLSEAYIKVADYFATRYDDRLRYAQKAADCNPESSRALRALAWAYWLSGKQDQALEVYRKLEALKPASFEDVMSRQPDIKTAMEKSAKRID